MRQKTLLATIVTLTFLLGSVFTTVVAATLAAQFDLPIALALSIGLTCLWSLLMWLISPVIMDLIQRWIYKARNITLDDLGRERPAVANFLASVCQKHGIPVPRLKMIDDMTPQAYCYGSRAGNARLVVTRGILHYLDDEEAKAVYGHELGHIVHRDFIVMTLASTLLQILWNVYIVSRNVRGKNNSRPLMPVAFAALAFYWVGQYMLLFLSRSREYYADAFSAEETGNANALSLALIKIAYGLTREAPTPVSVRLMGGTRALGISDPKGGRAAGVAFQATGGAAVLDQQRASHNGATSSAAALQVPAFLDSVRRTEKVMLFDLYNPWATVLELGSTHPLTGKRIRALGEQGAARGQQPLLSMDRIDASGQALDMGRMYGTFFFEIAIYFMPYITAAMSLMLVLGLAFFAGAGMVGPGIGVVVAAIGLGMTIKGFYRFGPLSQPALTTVLELMCDPYASPLRGRPVTLQGAIIGRADAGNRIGEDFVLEDQGGGLMPINYESPLGFLGNWWFASRKLTKLVNDRVQVIGWFRRGLTQQVDLERMHTNVAGEVSSYTAFWGKVGGIFVLVAGLGLAAVLWLSSGS
ncbi:MAG TPA: M48 family metalloprotease [Polyangiaceae bacterium]|jgi:Zn-dependent protease with chaperone function|nr:M48 family metalloprotease [Polyangiaceae bacterium]